MKRDIMSRIATLALAVVAAGFGAVSCAEEEIEVEAPMQKLRFAAASVYDNLPATRTIYSGDEIEVGGQKTERIDWVDGDRIYVRGLTCDQYIHPGSGGELTVASHVSESGSKHSVATLEGDANIHWAPNETNVFVAAYPSSTVYWEDDSQISPRFTGNIPATQVQSASHTAGGQTVTNPSMDYAAMVAKESVTERPTDPVTLHFSPAFTAFEFNMAFAGASGSNTISKFEMESTTTYLVGTWEWNYNSGVNSFTCDGWNKKITVNFDNQVIDADHPLRFTVFALPQQITNVTLKFYLGDNPTVPKTLSLKDKTTGVWEVFEPCKKYRISTPGAPADWEYVIECTDPSAALYTGEVPTDYTNGTVTSYKQKHDGSNKTAVEWEVEGYYTDADCTPANKLDSKPYWMTSYKGSGGNEEAGPGSTTGENVGITYAHSRGDTTETITSEAQALNAKISTTEVGTQGSPFNLANPKGINGADSDYIEESANSYIVNSCGWYRIPLVMGNGVKGDQLNPDPTTYKGYAGSGDDKRVRFKNYKGNNIDNPWLHMNGGTPTSAEIVWEDIEGLIETQKDASGANTYDLPEGCISSDDKWLYFHVPTVREGQYIYKDAAGNVRNEPRQGNAVIAVKDAGGTIMWSYHIWVTDYIPKNYPDYNASTGASPAHATMLLEYYGNGHDNDPTHYLSYEFPYRHSTRYLGYTIYGTTVTRDYPVNEVWVKLTQPVSGSMTVMKVTQTDGQDKSMLNRSQPFFQALRSAPLWTGSGIGYEEAVWFGKNPALQNLNGPVSVSSSIANPGFFISHPNGSGTSGTTPTLNQQFPNVYNAFFINEKRVAGEFSSSSPLAIVYNPHFYATKKTIYDPCPSGYVLPPIKATSHYNYYRSEYNPSGQLIIGAEITGPQYNPIQGFDDDGLSVFTDASQTTAFRYLFTPFREGNGGLTTYGGNGVFYLTSEIYYNHGDVVYFDPQLRYYGWLVHFYGSPMAAVVLPYEESEQLNPEDFTGYWMNMIAYSSSSGAPAPYSIGRYTVIQDNPEFE